MLASEIVRLYSNLTSTIVFAMNKKNNNILILDCIQAFHMKG